MRWFYFVKTRRMVALWSRHYLNATDADEAFYDTIRLFYPVPAIVFERGYPQFTTEPRDEEGTPPRIGTKLNRS